MFLLKMLPEILDGKKGWPWTVETNPDIYDQNIQWPKISIVTPSFNQGQFMGNSSLTMENE